MCQVCELKHVQTRSLSDWPGPCGKQHCRDLPHVGFFSDVENYFMRAEIQQIVYYVFAKSSLGEACIVPPTL